MQTSRTVYYPLPGVRSRPRGTPQERHPTPEGPIRPIDPVIALILVSGLLCLALLGPLRAADAPHPLLFAVVLTLFLAPGAFLARRLFGEFPGVAAVPVAFAASAGIFGLLAVPFLVLHADVDAYLRAAGAVVLAALAGAAITPRRRPVGGGRGRVHGAWWLPFWGMCALLATLSTRRVPSSNDDIWVYLSWVRGMSVSGAVGAREPYFGERTAELSRVHVNGWLLEQAALVRLSGIDPAELVLRYLTPTLVVVALLAVYALARALFESEGKALLCASVYALFNLLSLEPSVHNIAAELVARVPEDKHAARFLILPVALAGAVLYVRGRGLRYLGLFAALCWAVVTVHPVVLPALGLCMLGFGLAHVGTNLREGRRWGRMAALALAMWSVALGPALLLFWGRSPAAVLYDADINGTPPAVLDNLVFVEAGWRHIHVLADGSYIMHPWLLLDPAIAAAYLMGIPFLLPRVRRDPAAALLLGGLVAVAAAVYVPPVATLLGERVIVPGQLWRLSWPIAPLASVTLGWMAWEALRWGQERLGGRSLLARHLPVIALVVLLGAVGPPAVARGLEVLGEHEDAGEARLDPDPVYPWIGEHLPGGVVLAPDSANTALPAYSAAVDVVSLRGEPIILDREALERSAGHPIEIPQRFLDVHEFFAGGTEGGRRREILERHAVDYLMVPAGSPLLGWAAREPGLRPVPGAPREGFVLYRVAGA